MNSVMSQELRGLGPYECPEVKDEPNIISMQFCRLEIPGWPSAPQFERRVPAIPPDPDMRAPWSRSRKTGGLLRP